VILGVVEVVVYVVEKEVASCVVRVAVHAIVVGGAVAREIGAEMVRPASGSVLLPAIAEAVVDVCVGGCASRRGGACAVTGQIGADLAVELVVGIVPVAVDAVVGDGDIAVGSEG
jgi:hypothetical protein